MADGIRDLVDPREERLRQEMTHGPSPYNPWPDVYSAVDRGATWLDQQFPHVNPGMGSIDENMQWHDPQMENLERATSLGLMGINPGARAAPGTAGMFLGERATGAIPRNFEKAKQLRNAGYTSEQIWNMTPGQRLHYTDLDPSFKYEISDQAAQLKNVGILDYLKNKVTGRQLTMGDILDHPELYKNYPHLQGMPVDLMVSNPLLGGYYQPWEMVSTLGKTAEGIPIQGMRKIPERIGINTLSLRDKKPTVLHELQHAIQQHEGWIKGYDPKSVTDTANYNINKLSGQIPKIEEALDYLKSGKQIPSDHVHEGRSANVLNEMLKDRSDEMDKWKFIADNPHYYYEAAGGEAYARHAPARGTKMSQAEMDKSYPLSEGKVGGYRLEDLYNPGQTRTMLNSSLPDTLAGREKLSSLAAKYLIHKLDRASKWAYPGYLAAEGLTGDTRRDDQFHWWQEYPYVDESPPMGDMRVTDGGIANLLKKGR